MSTRRADRVARPWHAVTAVVAAGSVLFQLLLVLQGEATLLGEPEPLGTRLVQFISYFTVLTNILVAVSETRAARGLPDVPLWRVVRLTAVVGIAVTGLVHFVLLRPLLDLEGASYVADKLLHMVVPALAVVGWLVLGPRDRVRRSDLLPSLAYPVLWLACTLVAGEVSGFWPYPFVNADRFGYGVVSVNCLGVAVVFLAVSALALWADRRLPGERVSPASSGTTPRRPTGRT